MTTRVNGGIINDQTLTGSLRYFKMTGPFAWTVSNGSVNLPVAVAGGAVTATTYFVVGNDRPVPNSAAELVFREITKQSDVTIISCRPALYGATNEIHFACSASAFGWGSDEVSTAAAQMQAAVRALPNATVYVTSGSANTPSQVPATANVSFASVGITEVSFALV